MQYKKTSLKRLNDRGILKNDIGYRKQVFAIEDDKKTSILVRIINPNYRPLFERNIQAMLICSNNNIHAPRLIEVDNDNMEVLMTDVGDNIFDVTDNRLKNASWLGSGLRELKKLYDIQKKHSSLHRLPYFEKLQRITSLSSIERQICEYYRQKIQALQDVQLGYGIDDPSPTNFCVRNGIVSLIDFDNFFNDTSIWTSYGFAISSLFTKTKFANATAEEAERYLYSLDICSEMTTDENQLFRVGLLNNLVTLHYDDYVEGTNFSGEWEVFEKTILGIKWC